LRNKDILSLGCELLTRRSELLELTHDTLKERDDRTPKVIIRQSKTDPFGEGRIACTSRKTASHVRDWLDWRGPHFSPVLPDPSREGLTAQPEYDVGQEPAMAGIQSRLRPFH